MNIINTYINSSLYVTKFETIFYNYIKYRWEMEHIFIFMLALKMSCKTILTIDNAFFLFCLYVYLHALHHKECFVIDLFCCCQIMIIHSLTINTCLPKYFLLLTEKLRVFSKFNAFCEY